MLRTLVATPHHGIWHCIMVSAWEGEMGCAGICGLIILWRLYLTCAWSYWTVARLWLSDQTFPSVFSKDLWYVCIDPYGNVICLHGATLLSSTVVYSLACFPWILILQWGTRFKGFWKQWKPERSRRNFQYESIFSSTYSAFSNKRSPWERPSIHSGWLDTCMPFPCFVS